MEVFSTFPSSRWEPEAQERLPGFASSGIGLRESCRIRVGSAVVGELGQGQIPPGSSSEGSDSQGRGSRRIPDPPKPRSIPAFFRGKPPIPPEALSSFSRPFGARHKLQPDPSLPLQRSRNSLCSHSPAIRIPAFQPRLRALHPTHSVSPPRTFSSSPRSRCGFNRGAAPDFPAGAAELIHTFPAAASVSFPASSRILHGAAGARGTCLGWK